MLEHCITFIKKLTREPRQWCANHGALALYSKSIINLMQKELKNIFVFKESKGSGWEKYFFQISVVHPILFYHQEKQKLQRRAKKTLGFM